jgi:hypothetical protein
MVRTGSLLSQGGISWATALFPPYIVIASRDKLRGRRTPMKKLTFVVDERELSTIRAALFLLQEQLDALPEDLAEMIAERGQPMTVSEIERLSLYFDDRAKLRDHAGQELLQTTRLVEIERFPAIAHRPA